MIAPSTDRPRSLLSLAEERVLNALDTLAPNYEIVRGTRIKLPATMAGEAFLANYEPDFEVYAPSGHRIVVEVKSGLSLSLVNLSRFIKINEFIRSDGRGFLLLVWGDDRISSRTGAMPQFEALHIRNVQTDAEVVEAVKDEFRKTFPDGSALIR